MRRFLVLFLTIFVSASAAARDAAELQLALRKLTVVGGALYVAAHPDDENTAMLAWFANDRLVRTGYLSLTRGDGGQNLIGNEQGALLGIIRTQELLAARRIDHAEQLFTRAIDFGYSKSPEETLTIWGREAVLADVVRAIRRMQPDVIVMRFPITGEGGHGQHTASAILAEEAFVAAADPKRFPEQLQYVRPWQAKRIYWNRFSWRPVDPNDPALADSLRVDLGKYNPLLGRAYTEIAGESRSQHKSQGFGAAERRGTMINYLTPRGGAPAKSDPLEGVELGWSRYPGGERVGTILQRAADTFDPDKPDASVPVLIEAWSALEQLMARPEWSVVEKPWLAEKQRDLLAAIRDAAGIAIDVSAKESVVTPGAELPLSVTVVNRSDYPFRLAMVASIHGNPSKAPGAALENNKPVTTELTLKLPEKMPYSQPYWLERAAKRGTYTVTDQRMIGLPENPPELPIQVTLDDGWANSFVFTVPTTFRTVDPVQGEEIREVDIIPPVAVRLGSNVYIFPEAKPRPVTVWMKSFAAAKGKVWLLLPQGWKSEPQMQDVAFSGNGDEAHATFTVIPPVNADVAILKAEVSLSDGKGGWGHSHGVVEIDYPHIPPQRVLGDASAKLVRTDVAKRGERIGYIMGSGDDIPNVLLQLGYDVTLLRDEDLDRGNFSQFDAIIAGIRAYNTRDRLAQAHENLMQYVENGGTMVVQYNTMGDTVVPVPGPYAFKISRDRVTVEEAPVTFTDPAHPVLTGPNRITAADFSDWIQERGLYFPNEWDPKYSTVLSTNDPGESPKSGGLLVARHGKGVFVYTGYAWWRQLPAGVPGAIRMFVNLVSAE